MIEATGLPKMDLRGENDVYAELQLAETVSRTTTDAGGVRCDRLHGMASAGG
eukprot:COSAG01_NODE_1691_length_9480_cov_5.430231_3_plen_52_part_00